MVCRAMHVLNLTLKIIAYYIYTHNNPGVEMKAVKTLSYGLLSISSFLSWPDPILSDHISSPATRQNGRYSVPNIFRRPIDLEKVCISPFYHLSLSLPSILKIRKPYKFIASFTSIYHHTTIKAKTTGQAFTPSPPPHRSFQNCLKP